MKNTLRLLALSGLLLSFSASAFAGATVLIVNNNAPGVGFNDPTPAAPVGGNPGTTLGQQRLNAFQHAADIWGSNLDSAVPITILASFEPLTCTATSATLGSAGTITIWSFASGDANIDANTWYGKALTDKLAGVDVDSTVPDIRARFNSNLGNPGCLTGTGWYLGFDNNHGSNIDLVTVLLHEFAHGLGFQQFASVTSGAQINGLPDAYNKRLFDDTQNKFWPEMTNAQRAASAINFNHLVFTGTHVTDAVPGVLSLGLPGVTISAPASIAGFYAVGLAQFGAPVSSPGVSGQLVQALDAANASGPTTTDGCTAITNASDVAGRIAIIDRGTCGFVVKAKNAQNAGAIGVIIADNAPGAPPAGMAGVDPTVVIPTVRVTQSDGNAIKARLAASETVSATIALDLSVRAGADSSNRARINAPNPVQVGSSVSHWDPQTFRNQLMEPAINGDLTHSVNPPEDLTRPQLRDVGWYPDGDLDFVSDDSGDECLGSDLSATIVVGSTDTGVPNAFFTNGCTIADLLNKCRVDARNHGSVASCGAHVLDSMVSQGFITSEQKDIVQAAVAKNK